MVELIKSLRDREELYHKAKMDVYNEIINLAEETAMTETDEIAEAIEVDIEEQV